MVVEIIYGFEIEFGVVGVSRGRGFEEFYGVREYGVVGGDLEDVLAEAEEEDK